MYIPKTKARNPISKPLTVNEASPAFDENALQLSVILPKPFIGLVYHLPVT